jgi:hypothetical protein
MTCRVARSYQQVAKMESVTCTECGSTYMDMRVTSGTLGPHLCLICTQSVSPRAVSSVHAPRVPMRHQQVA